MFITSADGDVLGIEDHNDGFITKAEANVFNLNTSDGNKIDEFKTTYDSKPIQDQVAYFSDVTAAIIALQQGHITKSKFKTIVGIT